MKKILLMLVLGASLLGCNGSSDVSYVSHPLGLRCEKIPAGSSFAYRCENSEVFCYASDVEFRFFQCFKKQ